MYVAIVTKVNQDVAHAANGYIRMLQASVSNVSYYYSIFYGGGQKAFTEAGRPTALDQRSRLIVALTEAFWCPPR
jgi:hypothetical protein